MPGNDPRGGLRNGKYGVHILMPLTVLRRGLNAGAILIMSLQWFLLAWAPVLIGTGSHFYLALSTGISFAGCQRGQSYQANGKDIQIPLSSTKQTKKIFKYKVEGLCSKLPCHLSPPDFTTR